MVRGVATRTEMERLVGIVEPELPGKVPGGRAMAGRPIKEVS